MTNETHEIIINEAEHKIVETVPGWAHDIVNIGDEEMVLWFGQMKYLIKKAPYSFESNIMTEKLKVMTVVGTRPEIIRLSRVIPALDKYCNHILVHTGQNYDFELNQIFLMN